MFSFLKTSDHAALMSPKMATARRATRGLPKALLVIFAIAALGACGATNNSRSGLFEPFKVDIPQGNYVTQDMLAQIRTGMTTDQVRFALGAPLLNNLFQPDLWSYVFRYKHAGGRVDLRRLVIQFKDQRVAKIEGDDLPASEDGSDPFLPGYKGPPNKAAQK